MKLKETKAFVKAQALYKAHTELTVTIAALLIVGVFGLVGFLLNPHKEPTQEAEVEESIEDQTDKDATDTAKNDSKNDKTKDKKSKDGDKDAAADDTKNGSGAKSKTTKTPATAVEQPTETKNEEHVHNWVHKDEVTQTRTESRYVVDVPEHEEQTVTTVWIADGTEPNENGFPCLVGHEEERYTTYTVPEQGHYEDVVVATEVLEGGYDYCSECGARR